MQLSRRGFLAAAGAAAGATALPGAIGKAFAVEPNVRTGTIRDVEHVVVLMQENRSFDHYFGTMKGVRGFGDPRPWLLPNGRDVWHQPPASTKTKNYHARGLSADAEYVLPFDVDSLRTSEYIDGTNHGWSSGHLAWHEGRYDQWVEQKQDVLTMAHLNADENAYHRALAEAFTVCDAYHCSIHADTAPNRIYLWSGTIDSQNRLGRKKNGPGLEERAGRNGYTWTTYPERLQQAGVSWKLYQGGTGVAGQPTDNYTDNSLEFFAQYQKAEGASGPLVDLGASQHTLAELKRDVLGGTLPAVSWVVSPYKYSEHPSASPTDGAYYIDTVLDALTADPDVWAKTVLILNYDENDGFFDHVVPPMPPVDNKPGTDGMVSASLLPNLEDEILDLDKYKQEADPLVPGADPLGRQPIGLGPRVPLVIVSPWTKGGWVCSETFDHTSVLRFLEKRFDIGEPNISPWRRSVCGDLTSAFDFSRRNARVVALDPPAPIKGKGEPFSVPSTQRMPRQEQGVRRARALPYRFGVVVAQRVPGHLAVRFGNDGTSGCHFLARDAMNPTAAPRRYQVANGESIVDTWATAGDYDLGVWGPNGYLARLRGNAAERDEVDAWLDDSAETDSVELVLHNPGRRARRLRTVNSYDSKRNRQVVLPPGSTVRQRWELAASHCWYDLTVTDARGGGWLRRFAGHHETGRPGYSDPATRS